MRRDYINLLSRYSIGCQRFREALGSISRTTRPVHSLIGGLWLRIMHNRVLEPPCLSKRFALGWSLVLSQAHSRRA